MYYYGVINNENLKQKIYEYEMKRQVQTPSGIVGVRSNQPTTERHNNT